MTAHHGALTLSSAITLGELLTAVMQGATVTWYPAGPAGPSGTYVLRAVTGPSGAFWPSGDDVRDASVWMSGTLETFPRLSDLIRALDNARTGNWGEDQPMMTIAPPAG